MLKQSKIRSRKHLMFIASLPCLICERTDVQAAHIRHGNNAGMGLKSSDNCTVPLCIDCHQTQHEIGERAFWKPYDGGIVYATKLANDLHAVTGNTEEASSIIARWKI